eukprot:3652595-Pleurochrysis_carterae.AAC.1
MRARTNPSKFVVRRTGTNAEERKHRKELCELPTYRSPTGLLNAGFRLVLAASALADCAAHRWQTTQPL